MSTPVGGDPRVVPRETSQLQTTQVIYRGICGIPNAPFYGGDSYSFKFTVECPRPLCNLPVGKAVNHDAESQFLQCVISQHNQEIFAARQWICQSCTKPAKVLYHGMVPFLNPGLGASTTAFQPSVWDSVVPICISAGECDRRAEQAAKDFISDGLPGALIQSTYACEQCGGVKNTKRCTGCKRIW
ncbi:hypothetical protein EMCG_09320 [[Emmonsia] crescens]|uniref:Uncharacterized protein n=1 Tax=[Emmonsia] crescens TaxID=73230 RepID=A0A0G2J385_9EURO|nr:hypothetical protein EMCG_09320 [Emmonsia crescens UAMH 3008]